MFSRRHLCFRVNTLVLSPYAYAIDTIQFDKFHLRAAYVSGDTPDSAAGDDDHMMFDLEDIIGATEQPAEVIGGSQLSGAPLETQAPPEGQTGTQTATQTAQMAQASGSGQGSQAVLATPPPHPDDLARRRAPPDPLTYPEDHTRAGAAALRRERGRGRGRGRVPPPPKRGRV